MAEPYRQTTRLRPPPNYQRRGVQLQLMALVSLLMLVLWAMFHARDPRTWQWLWQLPRQSESHSDTPPQPGAETPAQGGDAAAGEPAEPIGQVHRPVLDRRRLERWREGWQQVDREAQRHFLALLSRAAHGLPDDQDSAPLAGTVLPAIEPWLGSLAADPDPAVDARFPDRLVSALQCISRREPLSEDLQQAVRQAHAVMEVLLLEGVKDNTPLRRGEHDAWFLLLRSLADGRTELPAATPVSAVQLMADPAAYRGTLVTLTGEARLGYRLPSPENWAGIPQCHILWLRLPDTTVPAVVYCLDLPPGFPDLPDRDSTGQMLPLRIPVRVTGVFFKRWVYQGQKGPNLAPLILAHSPELLPGRPVPREQEGLPSASELLAAVGLIGLAAVVCVAAIARYTMPGWSRIRAGDG